MLHRDDPPISEEQTHKIAVGGPPGGTRTTGYLPGPSSHWEALRPGCEFHLLRYAQTPLFRAPLTQPRYILDVGCGLGGWAAACQAHFPDSAVVGLDVKAPPRPAGELGFHFHLADVTQPLPFAEGAFDYVHLRFMGMVIPIVRWLPLLRECLRVLRPAGWLEVQDMALPRISHPAPWVWIALLGRANGVEIFPGAAVSKWLTQVGGTNISLHEHQVQRGADPNASARMMIRDGIALMEMCREAIVAAGITTEMAYEHEFRVMQHNLFIANREDTLPIVTVLCQKGVAN